MHVLAIDVGSYSIKYVSSHVERKTVTHQEMSEIILQGYMAEKPEMTLADAQLEVLREILDTQARPDSRIIYQAPQDMMTTRFLTLPVKSAKKANLMLPFQLEEDIPYALSEVHFAYRLEGQKSQHLALVELARSSSFDDYFNSLRSHDVLPSILTTESSTIENYFNQNPQAGPFCVVNIGHRTTRAYFFYNSRLLATNVSYIGGEDVTEMIAETYKITPDEAIFYKHQNAFVLSSSMMNEVDDSQREFATSMDQVLAPLISDFSRWRVGFKVNFGLALSQVYICGGSANIKNIASYLSEKWDVKVSLLESFDTVETQKVDANAKNKARYALANMMAIGFKKKNRFINLLTGRFAQTSAAELPVHSYAFIGVRVAAITAIFAISLIAERFFIQQDIQAINGRLTNVLKSEVLELNPRLRRQITTQPEAVLSHISRRTRGVKQEISTLQSAVQIKALSPLVTISQIMAQSKATLIQFTTTDMGDITAVFTAENVNELNKLQGQLQNSQLLNAQVQIDEQKLNLTLQAGM